MINEMVWLPKWTTPVKIEAGGRHPLGLNRFHNHLEDLLIKSIVWLAESLPHFTYSCWAIGDIAATERPDNNADFVTAFQRRETALSIGRYLWRPTDHIPGSTRVSARVRGEETDIDTSFSVMESDRLGAFGLYYSGSAYNLGLVEYDENGIPILTSAGQPLHAILDGRYRAMGRAYYRHYRGRARVPRDVLIDWGQANDPAVIRGPDGREERDFYKNLLFRLDQQEDGDYRRASLAFFLECIERCGKMDADFSENVLRNNHYYATFRDPTGVVRRFDVPDHFRDVGFYWNIYEGHVYFRNWLTRYFQTFLDHLKYRPGSTVEEFIYSLDADEFDSSLNRLLGGHIKWIDSSIGNIIDAVGQAPELQAPFSEDSIEVAAGKLMPPATVAAQFTLMMVDLWHHFRAIHTDQRYLSLVTSPGDDLWFEVLFHISQLPSMSVRHFLRHMLEAHIIAQHDRIMMEKRDLRRRWFTSENHRYYFVADDSLIDRPAKYGTIMAYLHDMGLITGSEGSIQLTGEGRELFARLKREFWA